jgi:hypothetical protein
MSFRMLMCASLFLLGFAASAPAQLYEKKPLPTETAPLPKPAEIQTLTCTPERVVLEGGDAAQQLVITATLTNDRLQDLSTDAQYVSADTNVVIVSATGRVVPVASGKTEITVRFGGKEAHVPVEAKSIEENLPINFANQIVPVFTKLGCNSGGCHGKASGQNGFKLSLLGFEPDVDFAALVKEARGRRLFPAAPDHSLLLLKASGQVAHGGGKRMEVGSDEYRLVRRWIAAGTPYGLPSDPAVISISAYPPQRTMTRQNKQQLAVYAHYSDGRIEDITRRAQYDSNDTEVAIVDADGLVRSLALSGEAAIMARYQGKVTVFRATVPLGVPVPKYAFEPKTVVDRYTQAKWRQLGIVPSELCSDEEFIRRAALDITGTLPTPNLLRAFVADSDPAKREKLVDRLVDSTEHSFYFATKWADILRVKRGNNINRAYGTFVFHDWIRHAIADDMPLDEFARQILGAVGDETKCPPVVWYKDLQTPDQFVDNAAQVFLGTRLQCAQCHHHPYEKWSQDDYWGLAAFFGRLGRKVVPVAGLSIQNQQQQRQVLIVRASGSVNNKRTNKPAVMKTLDSEPVDVGPDQDPRQKLVDWLVDARNPFFARAVANRYWAHFFNRGIVDPLDDMRVTNPPSNPELLDELAADFVENKYSLKHLVRTICKSRTYQLSSVPNEFNKHDKQAYARYYPRRMNAEVLFDAVCQATDSPTTFNGLPRDSHAPHRAIMLPDESFQSYFLDVFGRPQRISACECERVSEANLAQALHLLNSEEIQGKVSRAGGRADAMVKDARTDAEKVEELFLWTVGHKPSEKQLKLALDHLDANAKNKKAGYENILWALINTKEFVFNR